jgi:hypothetical protein
MQLETRMDRFDAILAACIGRQGDSRNECTSAHHRPYASYERKAILARHTDVTDQDIGRVPQQHFHRLGRRPGGNDTCITILEEALYQGSRIRLIVDDQHLQPGEIGRDNFLNGRQARRALRMLPRVFRSQRILDCCHEGQAHAKGRPQIASRALCADAAPMKLDELLDDRKS